MPRKYTVVTFLLFVFCTYACAQENTKIIVLNDRLNVLPIGKDLFYFEDSTSKLSINNIQSQAVQQKFKPHPRDVYIHSVSNIAVWFKIIVQNKTGEDAWLEAGGPYSCLYIDFYRPDSTGRYGLPVQTGSMRPEENKEYPVNFFWLRLAKAADTATKVYYVKMFGPRDAEYPLQAGTLAALHKNKQIEDYLAAGFVGLMLVMVFYNIFLFTATKQRIYVIYVGYLISCLFGVCYTNNYSLFPHKSWLNTHPAAWVSLIFFFVGWFTAVYLNLKKNYPRLFWLMTGQLFLLSVVFPLFILAGKSVYITGAHNVVLLFYYLTFFISGLYLYAKTGNIARYYFWGWIAASVSLIILQLETHGLIPYNIFLRDILYFGIAIEVLMFSFALGERFNTLKDEKEKAQAEYLELAAAQKRELEQKVEERTHELQEQSKYLEEVNATKDKLFSILGHDLRGPIANLKGMLDLSLDNVISAEEFQANVPVLYKGVEGVLYILEDLLQWSYAQRKGIKNHPVTINLYDIAESKLALFSTAAQAKKIRLTSTIPKNSFVFADENQVKLILRNLISNAIKFTATGGDIIISSIAFDDHIQVSVSDTGKGMTEAEIEKLFKATTNFTTQGTGGEKGLGLGLLLCREMAENNGGKIWVTSQKGVGSTFYFTVPVKKPA